MYIKCILLVAVVLGVLIVFTQPVVGQDTKKEPKLADAAIDLAVPDSPAFTVLGLTPNDVARPSSPREFVTSLLNGVDANGNFQTGIALEASPYMLLFGSKTTLEDYRNNRTIQFMSRTQVSFATAKGVTDDDEAARLAIGMRLTPWDESDPRKDPDLLECLKKAVADVEISQTLELEALLDERNRKQVELQQTTDAAKKDELRRTIKYLEERITPLRRAGTAELNKKSVKAIEACRNNEEYQSNLWNRSSWSLGVAPTFTSTTGETEDFNFSGTAFWTSLAFRLGRRGQVILHTRYRTDEEVPDANAQGQFFEQDSIRFGGRLRFGNPDMNFNIESSYVFTDRKDGREDEEILRYGASAEYKIAQNLWLALNVGGEAGDEDDNNVFILGNFKVAFLPKPTQKFDEQR